MLCKKLDAGWGVLPLAASLYVLTSIAPACGQSATGGGAPMSIQPATQPQSDGAKVSDKRQSNGPKVSDKKPTAPNAVVNLVNMLVKKGVLKEDQAQELIKEVDDETYVSQQATKDAKTKADEAAKAASAAAAAANPPGTGHVTYVPEVVKQQLRQEIQREVIGEGGKGKLGVTRRLSRMGLPYPFLRRFPAAERRRLLSERKRPLGRHQFQRHQHWVTPPDLRQSELLADLRRQSEPQ